jgi:hypothetical protein
MAKQTDGFKVWSYDEGGWVQNNFDQYVELNWTLPGSPGEQECFVDIKSGVKAEIILANEDGNYEAPDEPEKDDLPF